MINTAQVQIQIVTWNSRQHLPRLFAGIRRQAVDYDLLAVDNGSSDGTIEWLEQNCPVIPAIKPAIAKAGAGIQFSRNGLDSGSGAGMTIKLIQNLANKGFAAAHNQGFAVCLAPFVLVLNPDVELGEGFLEKCLSVIQSNTRIGVVTGKLYRRLPTLTPASSAGQALPSPLKGEGVSGIIDSCGLAMKPWGQVVNIGEGQPDRGQSDNLSIVFGVSGAAALYRLSALKSVADKYGIFDERFGSYKEDVDLAWRLSASGWKTIFVPDAVALHPRAVRHDNRASRGDVINQMSLRNHLLTLKKNLSWRDWWRLPLIASYELIKFIYVLLFERHNLKAYGSFHNYS